ncbi:hypothetical protein LEMLEM_LOCUS7189 [Lemmus lemmus]
MSLSSIFIKQNTQHSPQRCLWMEEDHGQVPSLPPFALIYLAAGTK